MKNPFVIHLLLFVLSVVIIRFANSQAPANLVQPAAASEEINKMKISAENGMQFLKLVTEIVDAHLMDNKFNKISYEEKIAFLLHNIKIKLEEKEHEIGETLVKSVDNNSLLNCYCDQLGFVIFNNHEEQKSDHFIRTGTKICHVGIFVLLAECVNKKLAEKNEKILSSLSWKQRIMHKMGWNHEYEGVAKFLEQATISIEHLFIYWNLIKDLFLAHYANGKNNQNGNGKDPENILTPKSEGLSRKRMFEFVSSKIEVE